MREIPRSRLDTGHWTDAGADTSSSWLRAIKARMVPVIAAVSTVLSSCALPVDSGTDNVRNTPSVEVEPTAGRLNVQYDRKNCDIDGVYNEDGFEMQIFADGKLVHDSYVPGGNFNVRQPIDFIATRIEVQAYKADKTGERITISGHPGPDGMLGAPILSLK
jgi:hypothetical protein